MNLLDKLFKGVQGQFISSKETSSFWLSDMSKTLKNRIKFFVLINFSEWETKTVKDFNTSNCNMLLFILNSDKFERMSGMYLKLRTGFLSRNMLQNSLWIIFHLTLNLNLALISRKEQTSQYQKLRDQFWCFKNYW